MLAAGDGVFFHNRGSGAEAAFSWTHARGNVHEVLAGSADVSLVVVAPREVCWRPGLWRPYDGVPFVIGREVPGLSVLKEFDKPQRQFRELQWVCAWPDEGLPADVVQALLLPPAGSQLTVREVRTILGGVLGGLGGVLSGLVETNLAEVQTVRQAWPWWAETEEAWIAFSALRGQVQALARDAMINNSVRVRRCRQCGCSENDCRQCVEKTGEPCYWVEADLCSACKAEVAAFSAGSGKGSHKKGKR